MSKLPTHINDVKDILDKMDIEVRYDVITDKIELDGNTPGVPKNMMMQYVKNEIYDLMKRNHTMQVSRADIDHHLYSIAVKNHYNSVAEMIVNGSWDGIRRYQDFIEMLGIQFDHLSHTLVRKWLIQTIAMALNDENKPYGAEGILTLQGDQGIRKTSVFRKLAVEEEWFCEGLALNVDNKDQVLKGTRSWITELGELDATIERKQSHLKSFITNPSDDIRPPCLRYSSKRPRRTSFCATVNPDRFLRDETGNRRFWIVPVKNIDKTLFQWDQRVFVQLWREIYREHYMKDPQGFRLTDEEIAKVERETKNTAFSYLRS